MRLRRFEMLLSNIGLVENGCRASAAFYHTWRVHGLIRIDLRKAHRHLPNRTSAIFSTLSWTLEHRTIIHTLVARLEYRILTRRRDSQVLLSHLIEIIASCIHAHFVTIKAYDAASLIHHMRLSLRVISELIGVLVGRKVKLHHCVWIHTHAVIFPKLLVSDILLKVNDAVSAAQDVILVEVCRRLLVHGGLTVVDDVSRRGQDWALVSRVPFGYLGHVLGFVLG